MKNTTKSLCSFGLIAATAIPLTFGEGGGEITAPEGPQAVPRAVVLGDYDADGFSDIYALNPYGEDRMYQNAGDGSFVDVTREVGLLGISQTREATFADYDGDGLQDLLIVGAQATRLFQNVGGSFVDVTRSSGLDSVGEVLGARWEDFEGDGELDLVLHGREGVQMFRGLGDATFGAVEVSVPGVVVSAVGQRGAGEAAGAPGGPGGPGGPGAPGAPGRGPAAGPNGRPAATGGSSGGSSAATAGITWTGTGAGPNMAASSSLACAGSVEDQANPGTGSCIAASSTPADGLLFPLGVDLFVDDATGHVGMGTLTPGRDLHLVGGVSGSVLISPETASSGGNSEIWMAEDDDGTFAMGLRYDGALNQLQLMSTTDGGATESGPWMSFDRDGGDAYFPSSDVSVEGGNVTVEGGNVMVGDATASHRLHVRSEIGEEPFRVQVTLDDGAGGSLLYSKLYVDDQGYVGVATTNPREDLSVGDTLDIYSGGATSAVNSVRGSGNNLFLNATGDGTDADTGDVYINYDTGDDLRIHGRTLMYNEGDNAGDSMLYLHNVFTGDASSFINCHDAVAGNTVFRVTSSGRTRTTAVEITGGGDLVEGFESTEGKLEPGLVVVIDPDSPGQVKTSSTAYDRKVAGVVSGAGGINHGIRMGQDGVMDGENLVAMTGRVYVKCTTENGSILAGDLLTTAGTAGHAMRADDPDRSFGSVIGKAMTSLEDETGLVLVLVNLQ